VAAERSGSQEDVLEVRLARAALLHAAGHDHEAARADAEDVLDASAGVPHRVHLMARAARQLAVIAQVTGGLPLAERAATLALPDVERYGSDEDFNYLLDALSGWFALAGYRRLSTLVRRAAAAQADRRNPAVTSLLSNLATYLVPDDPAEGIAVAAEGIAAHQALGMNELPSVGHYVVAALNLGRWAEAEAELTARAASEPSQLLDWETYLMAGSAVLAWERADPTKLLRDRVEDATETDDAVVEAWRFTVAAVDTGFQEGVAAGAVLAARAVESACRAGLANEDVPLLYALAVDMLLEARDLQTLERVTVPLLELTYGQRYRLLQGQLLRAQAHLSGEPVAGLRQAVEVFDRMGAAFWSARTGVELAVALEESGDAAASAAAAAAAEPLLREIGATRALVQLDALRSAVHVD
jgi:hypothetical protein